MVDSLEDGGLCLWNSSHNPSADDLFWNRARHWLLDLAAGIGHLVFAFDTRSIGGFLWAQHS